MDPSSFALALPKESPVSQPQRSKTAVIEAWEKHVSKLDEKEKIKFESHCKGDLAGYVKAISLACKDQRKHSRSFKIAEWFEPLFKALNMYMPPATSAIQAYPNPGALVLGGIVCIMQISERFLSYQERIATMLSRMGRKVQKLLQYEENIYRNEPDVQSALVEIYGDILDFCKAAFKLFSTNKGQLKSGLKTLSLSLWRPFETDFGAIVDKFELDLEEVEDRAALCDKQRFKESLVRQREDAGNFTSVAFGMIEFFDRQQVNYVQDRRREQDFERASEKRRIIQWLPSSSFHKQYDANCAKHLANTGQWLLESNEYLRWKGEEKSEVLWIKGKPGCGKSVLAALAISDLDLAREPGIATAYVFCMNNDAAARDPLVLACSLLRQLCQQYSGIDGTLKKIYDDTGDLQHEGPEWQQATKALASVVSKFVQVFIVVDGLDECGDEGKFATLLRTLVDKAGSGVKVKLLVLSRPEHLELEDAFTGCKCVRADFGANDEDIRTYITSKFTEDENTRSSDKKVLKTIRDICLVKADGMFLWVDLLAQSLKSSNTGNKKLAQLKNIPKGLDTMYEKYIRRIWAQDEEDRTMALNALIWTTNAIRPLTEAEMLEAIAIKPGTSALDDGDKLQDAASLIALCADLILLNNEGCFDLIHASVKDYLTKIFVDAPHPMAEYRVLQLDAHRRLGELCLTYLLFETFKDGPAATVASLRELRKVHPFLLYAAKYWGPHVAENAEGALQDLTRKLTDHPEKRELSIQFFLFDEDDEDKDLWTCRGTSTSLHVLSMFGLRDTAKTIPDVHLMRQVCDGRGYLPIHFSLLGRSRAMCLWLLELDGAIDGPRSYLPTNDLSLHFAAQYDWADVVENLISKGADVNLRAGKLNATPLHRAAIAGAALAMEILLTAGADPNLPDEEGDTPLLTVALKNHQGLVKPLLAHGADVNACDTDGVTPLHYAAQEGSIDVVNLLLGKQANPLAQAKGCANQSPIHIAAEKDSHEVIRRLDQEKVDLESKCIGGYTPLHIAAFHNSTESAKVLVSLGASVAARDDFGSNSLHMAAQYGSFETWKALLELQADFNAVDGNGRTPLHIAVLYGKSEIVRDFLSDMSPTDARTMINTQDEKGWSALHFSMGEEVLPELVELLLAYGADATLEDHARSTPLHYAARYGHGHIIELLLKNGADIEACNEVKDTALHLSALHGQLEFVKRLFDLFPRIEVNKVNSIKRNALYLAASSDHHEISEFLISRGAISMFDVDGNLPMHLASWNGSERIVKMLISHEGVTAKGYLGRSALFNAAHHGHLDIARLLLENGAGVNDQDDFGFCPVVAALAGRHISVANLLLDHGADLQIPSKSDRSVLDFATGADDVRMVRRLLDNGCDGLARSFWGTTPFTTAVSSDSLEIVELLLQRHFNGSRLANVIGQSPFQVAVEQGNLEMMNKLLANGAEASTPDSVARNAMHFAASKGQFELIHYLLDCADIDIEATTIDGYTPLMIATSNRYVEFARALLKLGASINSISIAWKWTPIALAAFNQAPQLVELFLEAGADPYHRNALGLNALDYAAIHPPTMRKFLERGFCHTPADVVTRKKTLRRTTMQCLRLLCAQPSSPSVPEQFLRVLYIDLLGYSLIHIRDDAAHQNAIPLLSEILYEPEKAYWAKAVSCGLCGKSGFAGHRYTCLICVDDVLCTGCHLRYVKGDGKRPRRPPDSIIVLATLEKELLALRKKAQMYSSVLVIAAALFTFVFVRAWLDDKQKEYEKWELEHNADGIYNDVDRPGKEFIKLVREATKICEVGDAERSAVEEIQARYVKFDRKHKGDQEYKDFTCCGHEFLLVDEDNRERMIGEGDILDSEGRVTGQFLQVLAEKYDKNNFAEEDDNDGESNDQAVLGRMMDHTNLNGSPSHQGEEQSPGAILTAKDTDHDQCLSPEGDPPRSLHRATKNPTLSRSNSLPTPNPSLVVRYVGIDVKQQSEAVLNTQPDAEPSSFSPSLRSPQRSFTEPTHGTSTAVTRVLDVEAKVQNNLRKNAAIFSNPGITEYTEPKSEQGPSVGQRTVTRQLIAQFESTTETLTTPSRGLSLTVSYDVDGDDKEDAERPTGVEMITLKYNYEDIELRVLILAIELADVIRPGFAASYVREQLEAQEKEKAQLL